jgi:hypothetical protein
MAKISKQATADGRMVDAMRNGLGQSIDGKNRLVCCFQPDLLAYYVENMHDLHEKVVVDQNLIKKSLDGEPDEVANSAGGGPPERQSIGI